MRGGKRIVHIDVGERRQTLGQFFRPRLFLFQKAHILEHQHIAGSCLGNSLGYVGSDHRIQLFDRLSKECGQPLGHLVKPQ